MSTVTAVGAAGCAGLSDSVYDGGRREPESVDGGMKFIRAAVGIAADFGDEQFARGRDNDEQ